jgi:hypothetical protein
MREMIVARFILRFLLVPLGIVAAATVGLAVVIVGEWNAFITYANANPDAGAFVVGAMVFAPFILMVLAGAALAMMAPGAIGILASEFFALRSWIFHVGNGALSAWVGWSMIDGPRGTEKIFQDPKIVIVMGLFAGLTYWLIAGWSAGFWKPVFAREDVPAPAAR